MNNKKYYWTTSTPEHIRDMIEMGDYFFFQFNGKDYFIERGENGYIIQDPDVQDDGSFGENYSNHYGHEKAKTPEELINLPFLDGKTIFEAFDELKFFD